MRRLVVLYARMLRYRVAAMLWLFMLLGAAAHDGLTGAAWRYACAALALGSAYVAATSVNDVADADVDRVNHPRDRGRPLVSGAATAGELRILHRMSALLAVLAAVPLGPRAVGLAAASVAIGRAYSLPPLRLSYRTYLTPPVLGAAYVLVPYGFGREIAGGGFTRSDVLFAAALFAFFVARIVLKDFRDRAGDAHYGKPTLLLRFGKTATCSVSVAALIVGDVLLVARIWPGGAAFAQLFVAAIAIMLHRLWRTPDPHLEQVAIGIGARLGNGLLLLVLGRLVLAGSGASPQESALFATTLTALFALSFATLATRPDDVAIGYKG